MLLTDLYSRVHATLQDDGTRWPSAELLQLVSDAQRQIVIHRPDATAVNDWITLDAGIKQSMPTGAVQLLDVTRNENGRIVRLARREDLDAQDPYWPSKKQSNTIRHYVFDLRDPKTFYVDPPAKAGAKIEAIYSVLPTEPTTATTLPAIYDNAIVDYVIYRALMKDADYAANQARAALHYQQFAQTIGIKTQTDTTVQPNTASPNATASAT